MGMPYEDPVQKARRLANKALSQIRNPAEKKKFAESLGFTLGTGRSAGTVQGGAHLERQTYERITKAFEGTSQPSKNPRLAAQGGTTTDIAKFQEQLGETPQEEYARRAREEYDAMTRPFRELEQAEKEAAAAAEAFKRQQEEQARIQKEVEAGLAEAERKAKVAGKRSAVTSQRARSKAMLEQAQVQQAQAKTAQQLQRQQKQQKATGSTVGQPRRARTRVGSGLSIGGYGGTRAARVSPTGLNI